MERTQREGENDRNTKKRERERGRDKEKRSGKEGRDWRREKREGRCRSRDGTLSEFL